MIELKVLESEHMPKIILERNKILETLRTPYLLNANMQDAYFRSVICNRDSKTRYYAGYNDKEDFVLMGGLENIIWENGIAEISLLVFEEHRKKGYGREAVKLFLDNAFNYFNLINVYGECYTCNEAGLVFWGKIIKQYDAYQTILPNRKYYNGHYHDSIYFNINKVDFV